LPREQGISSHPVRGFPAVEGSLRDLLPDQRGMRCWRVRERRSTCEPTGPVREGCLGRELSSGRKDVCPGDSVASFTFTGVLNKLRLRGIV
jgi:hypothetical protein